MFLDFLSDAILFLGNCSVVLALATVVIAPVFGTIYAIWCLNQDFPIEKKEGK